MIQEKRIELIVAVEDHGWVFDATTGSTPFAPNMAGWRQGTRQGKGIFLMNSLYILDGDIDLTHTCQNELSQACWRKWTVKSQDAINPWMGYLPVPSIQHVQRCLLVAKEAKRSLTTSRVQTCVYVGTCKWSHHFYHWLEYWQGLCMYYKELRAL